MRGCAILGIQGLGEPAPDTHVSHVTTRTILTSAVDSASGL